MVLPFGFLKTWNMDIAFLGQSFRNFSQSMGKLRRKSDKLNYLCRFV